MLRVGRRSLIAFAKSQRRHESTAARTAARRVPGRWGVGRTGTGHDITSGILYGRRRSGRLTSSVNGS
jgi:hypothetical protein